MHASTGSVPIVVGEMNGGGDVSSAAELQQQHSTDSSNPELTSIGADGVPSPLVAATKTILLNNYPSRSRLIISLCLLEPNNSPCSIVAYDLIRSQLQLATILNVMWGVMLPKSHPIDMFCEEVLLLLTIAVNHPAFTYEQRDIMNLQKKEIEAYFAEQLPLIAAATAPQYLCGLLPGGLTQISPAPSISSVSSVGGGSTVASAAGAFINNAVVPVPAQSPVAAVSLLGNSLSALRINSQPVAAVAATAASMCPECASPPMAPSYHGGAGAVQQQQSSSSASSNSVSPKSSPNSNNTDNWPKLTTLEGHQLQHPHPPAPPHPAHHHHNYINNYHDNGNNAGGGGGGGGTAGKNKPNMATSPPKSHSMSSSSHHHHHHHHNNPAHNSRNRNYRDRHSSGSSSAHNQQHLNNASESNIDDRGVSSSPPSSTTSTASTAGGGASSSCYNCGKGGHRANQCPASAASAAPTPAGEA